MINELHVALDLLGGARKTLATIPSTATSPNDKRMIATHISMIDETMDMISRQIGEAIPDLHG